MIKDKIVKNPSNFTRIFENIKKFGVFLEENKANFSFVYFSSKNASFFLSKKKTLKIFLEFNFEFYETLKRIKDISSQKYEEIVILLNPKLFFLKFLKLFKCEGGLFWEIDQKKLEEFVDFAIKMLDLKEFAGFINKNRSFIEEIANSFCEQSFGNAVFSKILYFFTRSCFDTKIRRSFLIFLKKIKNFKFFKKNKNFTFFKKIKNFFFLFFLEIFTKISC